MQLTDFKKEFLHPRTPDYIMNTLFEKLCFKDTQKGLSEEDIIAFICLLRHPDKNDRASLAFQIFDIKNEGKIPVSNFFKFGNTLLSISNETINSVFKDIGYGKDDRVEIYDF